ncbi:MAG: DUF4339 domain-containing protein [Chlamydiales bacterium]
MGIMQLLNLTLFWFFFGCTAAYLAKKRGRHPLTWFWLGLGFGLPGILILMILPPKIQTPPPTTKKQENEVWLKMWYYLDPSHLQQGPMPLSNLAKDLQEKRLFHTSYVWGEGMKEWKQLIEMPDLISEIEKIIT